MSCSQKYGCLKMLIRPADLSDLQDIFEWRNDSFSRSMFLSSKAVSLNEHIDWYQRCLKNPHKKIFIGLIDDLKIGVVRFDFDVDTDQSEVSINLNPQLRGNGYGFTLLSKSISLYEQSNDATLIATIKKENSSSLKIFSKCNFHKKSEDDCSYHLIRSRDITTTLIDSPVNLEKVTGTEDQIRALYDILIKRTHNISNTTSPSIEEHIKFVQNHPYRIWYLVKTNSDYIGSVYLMENNCVGINLIRNIDLFQNIVKTILEKHKPLKEIKSVRPSYFYINITPDNEEIQTQLMKLHAQKIQSTFIITST